MEPTLGGIIGTIIFGAVIGILARLIKPGRQNISMVATVVIGIIGAVVGYFLAALIGVEATDGIDWIRWIISIVVAIIVLGIYLGMSGRKGGTRP
ncbi:MAG TPA: GlsB/YeaQ/YmgE family stress response membrane protein [Actinotalea caeni]|uniref:GlsB/YeaQ/YmgE family stress response membrane protein n=1 Tax=Actinotalea caeni TaxID=1348467 RepID=UPI002B4ACD5A|nr:GlsB/YeaQ/YmgE family stress response membrane protein [Actinotalea caeni]HLV56767.1 GlsB/YeaQ/YmgE family stress response membrane protein [Actinotalea caeni]